MKPRVSWLMCTHREDALLHRAVASCLAQTMASFELVLVANGPLHEALVASLSQAYQHDPRVVVVGTPMCLLNFALDLGLHIARSDLVARMDADDVAHPERLARQVAYLERHARVAVLGSAYHLIDAAGRAHGTVNLPPDHASIRRAFYLRNPVCHPAVMLRRDVMLTLGGYLGGQNAEDYDLWSRLLLDGRWEFANLPEALLSYNIEPGAARRSRRAYANVAAAQLRNFLVARDPRWLAGALISSAKSVVRANQD